MATDWKDALGALLSSGDIPVDNTPEPEERAPETPKKQKAPLTVSIDRKGRKGKTATIIEGFLGTDEELEELARTLKQKLGTGGSTRDGEILIQGERRKETVDLLTAMGYKAK